MNVTLLPWSFGVAVVFVVWQLVRNKSIELLHIITFISCATGIVGGSVMIVGAFFPKVQALLAEACCYYQAIGGIAIIYVAILTVWKLIRTNK